MPERTAVKFSTTFDASSPRLEVEIMHLPPKCSGSGSGSGRISAAEDAIQYKRTQKREAHILGKSRINAQKHENRSFSMRRPTVKLHLSSRGAWAGIRHGCSNIYMVWHGIWPQQTLGECVCSVWQCSCSRRGECILWPLSCCCHSRSLLFLLLPLLLLYCCVVLAAGGCAQKTFLQALRNSRHFGLETLGTVSAAGRSANEAASQLKESP